MDEPVNQVPTPAPVEPPVVRPVARRPRTAPRPVRAQVATPPAAQGHPPLPWIAAAIAAIAIIVFGTGALPTYGQRAASWSAVFLTTGQVFFGHVAEESDDALLLRDVYYLQGSALQGDAAAQNLSLVKLGSELHGPKDAMRINRAHVLFTQELRDDATVVRTIDRMRESAQSIASPPSPAESALPSPDASETPPAQAPETPATQE